MVASFLSRKLERTSDLLKLGASNQVSEYEERFRYLPEKKIRKFLKEPIKLWHYIKAKNTEELLHKLKKIIEIIEMPIEKLDVY